MEYTIEIHGTFGVNFLTNGDAWLAGWLLDLVGPDKITVVKAA